MSLPNVNHPNVESQLITPLPTQTCNFSALCFISSNYDVLICISSSKLAPNFTFLALPPVPPVKIKTHLAPQITNVSDNSNQQPPKCQ